MCAMDINITELPMDINKQRLLNRLNVKFEPLKKQPGSLKKLQIHDKYAKDVSKDKEKQISILQISRDRSISHLRLPSLEKKTAVSRMLEEKTEEMSSVKELRQRIRSIRALPTIKVQSREPINNTLTFLIKNQILTIPKIVAMLQKAKSQEFMYMKVKGIYEYEVCTEQEKGSNYITLSKNGMVTDGQLVPLERLVYEYDLYQKLGRICFFKFYTLIKYMNKWNHGSKVIKFFQTKYRLKKLLYLQNQKILRWKIELRNTLLIESKGGSVNSGWVDRVSEEIEKNKVKVEQRLLVFSIEQLEKFKLPISASFELINNVLGNMFNLSLKFQQKMRVEKELQVIYKVGRMLQLQQQQSISFYLLQHLDELCSLFKDNNANYLINVLQPIQKLDTSKPNYVAQKEKILRNAQVKDSINFKIFINDSDDIVIEPSMHSILKNLKADITNFITKIDKFDTKIIRLSKFDFVTKNVVKVPQTDDLNSTKKDSSLKQHIYSLKQYLQKITELENSVQQIAETCQRKFKLLEPFYQIYKHYKARHLSKVYQEFNYEQINNECQQVDQNIRICQLKLHDGEYFILGYLSQLEIKEQIVGYLNQYKDIVMSIIPIKIRMQRQQFYEKVLGHLNFFRLVISTPSDYIKVYQEFQDLEEKLLQYAADLNQIDRLQQIYLRIKKIELGSLAEERNLLSQLKIKVKNFKETKENSYLLYRKELESMSQELITKILSIEVIDDYYEISDTPLLLYNKCHRTNVDLIRLNENLLKINELQSFFNMKQTIIGQLSLLSMKFEALEEVWNIYKQFETEKDDFNTKKIMKIEAGPQIKKYELFLRKIEKYSKDPDFYKIAHYLLQKIPPFLSSLYFVEDLHNEILREQDFAQISQLLEKEYKIDRNARDLTFQIVLKRQLFQLRPQILQLSFKSHKEQQIDHLLEQFTQWWKGIRLQGQYLDEYPLIIIFNDNDQLRQQIEEYTTTLLNIINHKYGTSARKECNKHLRNINALADMLSLAVIHQEKFLSLFPILTSKYAQKQLPGQSKKFLSIIEKSMKNVKWLIKPTENLNETTRSMLNNHIKQFDSISKTIAHFLQKKRVKFQRFYFLQDDELLEVLVGIGAENTIFRMFEGVKGWIYNEDGIKVGVEGVGGEQLKLRGWSYKQQQPQVIFKSLEDAIRTNLNSIVRLILHGYENELKQLGPLYNHTPWMCVYTVELVLFTKQMQINCFQNGVDLSMQSSLIQENIAATVTDPMKNSNYITLQLFLLHYVEELRNEGVSSIFDFKWYSFLRYYFEKDSVVMKAMGSQHHWGGEYQGLWNLMINTSDIRRAHTSILSNLRYGNGVLLQGPSGTGKTESLKQLSRCMGKYCVIFNCSNEVNIRTLQKLLSGLCYTGSWLCLDQINRLTAQIMSVVANQINTIKNAVVQQRETLTFLGKQMRLKHGVGIFSTMNPIYLKRAKLTANLKSYFRIISVNVPDYQKILQVLLYSLGISSSSQYAAKISKLFKNLSIQLTHRPQYDFGLRAMKYFIFNLSTIRRSIKNQEESIIQGLHKTFYSRLDEQDKEVFLKVLDDNLGKKKVQKENSFKVEIMKEAPQTGIIVMGPTSTKTTIIKQYIETFDPKTTNVEVFNPNSLDLKYFLGESQLGRWEQGVVEKCARASFENPLINYILVLDTQIKSETIENFNSLLDESKLLSLSNGTRLKIHNNFKIIMETPDLQLTSPATITRCSVIYVNEKDIKKKDLIARVVPTMNVKQQQQKIDTMLYQFNFDQILKIVKLAKVIFPRLVDTAETLNQSESIGFEKCLTYSIHILGYSERVKAFLSKENSLSQKKNAFNYWINFSKYKEGDFVQFQHQIGVIKHLGDIYIPTTRHLFYKYVNFRALEKQESIIWKGERMTGKTFGILMSFEDIFKNKQEEKEIVKITINPKFTAKKVIELLEEKTIVKEQQDHFKHTLLVYIDDINLANEEMSQFVRYTAEYKKMFSLKNKVTLSLPNHLLIADASNQPHQEFNSRFCRHFVEISIPETNESIAKHIFANFIKAVISTTKTSSEFKASLEMQLDKLASFLWQFLRFNNQAYDSDQIDKNNPKDKLQFLNYGHLIPIIKNMWIMNELTCKDINDLATYIFSELRVQEVEHSQNERRMAFIKLAYNEVFKNKYQTQYGKTLKSSSGHPTQCLQYSMFEKSFVQKIDNWNELKKNLQSKIQEGFYISEFVLEEIVRALRVLEWRGGHYMLIGQPGVGKRTILKISAFASGKQVIQAFPTDEKKISQWYFSMIKTSFEKRKDQLVIMQIKQGFNMKILAFLEQIWSHYPSHSMFISQYCDYAYNNAQYFDAIDYQKFSKPYNEVIEDFISIAKKNIQFLFFSMPKEVSDFNFAHHYLHKDTTYRWITEFPSESILEISSKILQSSSFQLDKQKVNSILLKIYSELTQLMRINLENNAYHFKYSHFCHFNLIKKFIQNYKLVLEKAKQNEDILNRSILKVHEISQMLEKLKLEIKAMEPKVKQKTQKLLDVVPILDAKKKATQEVKAFVMNEKQDIEHKNSEVQEMMRQVELKIKKSQPLLLEANESMLTIKRGELSELRNNSNPHPLIRFTLENMSILLGESQSFQSVKKMLSDPNLLSRLKSINPSQAIVVKVQRRIQQNPQWTFQNVSKISYGIRYMVRWTNSIIKFYFLKVEMQQQKSKVEQYKRQLRQLQQKLSLKQQQLNAKQMQIGYIQNQYRYNKDELINLQELVAENNKKYENAELIKNHLQEEIYNWHKNLEIFKNMRKNVAATAIMITLYLEIYCTLHAEEATKIEAFLAEMFQKLGMPVDPNFNVSQYVKDELLKQKISNEGGKEEMKYGHPSVNLKSLSIQDSHNSRIIQTLYHMKKNPIFLDPDNQALNWLERQVGDDADSGSRVLILKQSFLSAVKNVQMSLKQGHILVVLIQNQLDQFVNDILYAKVTEIAGNSLIEYNKSKFSVHRNFRLILCNKSRNPDLSSKLYISHPVLNFQITRSLLKTMLLQQLIRLQNSEMYNFRKQLQLQTKMNSEIIGQIQQQIIESLINSKKNLIDDGQFMHLLNKNQAKRNRLKENQTEWMVKNIAIKKIFDHYEKIAEEVSKIFISLKLMSKVSSLLTWNTQLFVQYFKKATIESISTPLIEEDEESFEDQMPSPIRANYDFDNYNIGLGNSRPTSALSYMSDLTNSQLGASNGQERKDDFEEEHPISQNNFQNLIGLKESFVDDKLKGTMSAQRAAKLKYNLIEYIKPAFSQQERVIWGLVLCLMEYDFKQIKGLFEIKTKYKILRDYAQAGELSDRIKNYLTRNIEKSHADIQAIMSQPNPFKLLGDQLSQVDILLLGKILIPNNFSSLCQTLIRNKGYEQLLNYSESSTLNWFQRSDNIHPILLIMGEDPIYRISDYLSKRKYKNVILIPMGQGQNKLAEVVLEKQSRKQNLVIIHNLHISENFMIFLPKMLQQFQIRPPHKNFRLILISARFQGLSEQITNYCHKYLIQQPAGIKNQIRYLRQQNGIIFSHPFHKKLAFVLTYLHAIINNLSKFKPYGWNLKYQFHTADYLSSLQKLKEIAQNRLNLENYQCNIDLEEEGKKLNLEEIDFKALRYMIGEIGYVGKLADDIDRVKMNLLIDQFVNPSIFKNQSLYQAIKSINFSRLDAGNAEKIIEQIPEHDSTIFGLHEQVRPVSENERTVTARLSAAYLQKKQNQVSDVKFYDKSLEPINHKFQYINKEISKYNEVLEKIKINGTGSESLKYSLGDGSLLSTITAASKVFNLRAFSNPKQFFISIKKDVAHKNNVTYEKVELLWSLALKENAIGMYGISNLKLEGASLNSNRTCLDDGLEERDVTVYVQAVVTKKQRDTKRLVAIPIYLDQQRQGQINSYGHNTNLLGKAYLQANYPQSFWILRSTAFIVC